MGLWAVFQEGSGRIVLLLVPPLEWCSASLPAPFSAGCAAQFVMPSHNLG